MLITLVKGSKSWIAEYSGPGSAEIIELFGTNKIPTAYGVNCPGRTVLEAITHNNPKAEVVLNE